MRLPILLPFPKMFYGGFYPWLPVLKRLLNEILNLSPPLVIDEKYTIETDNALKKFKDFYYAKYKQRIPDYGLVVEELYIALGKELRETDQTKFDRLVKDLNDPQWTLLLTGKIYEMRAIGKKIDLLLKELFTKNGVVEGASQFNTTRNRIGLGLDDNHFYLKDGQLHTIHIYNDSTAGKPTGIYIPKNFSQIDYEGGRMASVINTNPVTKEIIRASHIAILPELQLGGTKGKTVETAQDRLKIINQLKKNTQTTNDIGSRYIGDTGGPQGDSVNYIHSHLTMFKNNQAMVIAMKKKYAKSEFADYDSSMKQYLGDFRSLVKLS